MQTQSIKGGALTVEYTNKPLSGFGGLAVAFEYFDQIGFTRLLRDTVPDRKTSNNSISNADLLLVFFATVLVGGDRFTHVERVRHDEVIRQIIGAARMGGADALRAVFTSLSRGEAESLYEDCQRFLNVFLIFGGNEDVIDLDSTLLARYGAQEGVGRAFNSSRSTVHGAHHPLLAMLAGRRHIVHAWLRDGSSSTLRGAAEFVDELLARLPEGFKITAIRADSGFHNEQYLRSFEEKGIPYIVAVRMHAPLRKLAHGIAEEQWRPLRPGVEVAELQHKQPNWARARRLILLRRTITSRHGGRMLFEIPLVDYDAFVTTLELPMTDCVAFYNKRGDCENIIKELKNDFGAKSFCLTSFYATELVFRMITVLFNLVSEFKRHVLRDTAVTLGTIRMRVFVLGAVLGRRARRLILRLGATLRWRDDFDTLLQRATTATLPTSPRSPATA